MDRLEIFQLNNEIYQNFDCHKFDLEFKKLFCNRNGSTIKLGFYVCTYSLLLLEVIFKYKPLLKQQNNIDIVIEVFTHSIEDKYFNKLLRQSFGDLVKINSLNEIIDGNDISEFELDYLLCQPVDVKYSIMKKNLISDLIYIQKHNSKKGKKLSRRL